MDRRNLIVAGATAAVAPWLLGGCTAVGRTPSRTDTVARTTPVDVPPPADAALLNRVTWGLDAAAIARLDRAGSPRAYLASQLRPPGPATLPVDVQARIDALPANRQPMSAWVVEMAQRRQAADRPGGEVDTRRAARQAYQQAMNGLANDAATELLLHAIHTPNQLQEQLTWFWTNHFNVHQRKADLRAMVGDYARRLRPLALGRFEDLLIASATHPAMIRYLDNQQNAVGRINENYAREVMELHTLGVDGGYTQQDVQELARVLTGLGSNFGDPVPDLRPALRARLVEDRGMRFNPARHDGGEKRVLGERIAPDGGYDEIVAQLTRLARRPETARHVSRRLAVYFVSDSPSPALVERMSAVFLSSRGEIAAVLQAMFEAPEFAASLGRKFKDPMHYVVSAVRLVGDGASTAANLPPALGWLNRLGEAPFDRQTPDGYPLDEGAWSASGQMSTRFEIARAIAGSGAASAGAPWIGAWVATFGPRTRASLERAPSPTARTALLLSSPEFMLR